MLIARELMKGGGGGGGGEMSTTTSPPAAIVGSWYESHRPSAGRFGDRTSAGSCGCCV